MRVALEASALAEPGAAGVARYARELARALAAMDGVEPRLWYRLSRLRHRNRWWRPDGIPVRTWQGNWWPPRPGVDLVHGLDGRAPDRRGLPFTVTIHDLTVLKFDHAGLAEAGFRERKLARYRALARGAGPVICVSEATARDATELLGINPGRVRIVPHGVDPRFRPLPPGDIGQILHGHDLAPGYLLYVGTVSERKNTERLVRAYARTRARRDGRPLVLAGRLYHRSEPTLAAVRELGLEGEVRCLGAVADADLPALYNGAAALLLPSLYEGFGLPVLEALACGIPVLCANRGGAPEVAADCALTVEPDRTRAIAEGIDAVLDSPPADRDARLHRAARFTWDAAARQTVAVYRELLA